jgi:hypothetical protein
MVEVRVERMVAAEAEHLGVCFKEALETAKALFEEVRKVGVADRLGEELADLADGEGTPLSEELHTYCCEARRRDCTLEEHATKVELVADAIRRPRGEFRGWTGASWSPQ